MNKKDAQALAMKYGISYHEASAKKNIGLKEMFEDIFEKSYGNKWGLNS